MKKKSIIFAFIMISFQLFSQSEWKLIEKTNLQDKNGENVISGTISSGFIFKTWPNGDYYIAGPLTLDVVVSLLPEVKIYHNGLEYKLVIEDFDEPIFCEKIKNVIETQIDGEFEGWEGENIFKMMNGQIWQQSSYSYVYHYAYSPEVLIYEYRESWIMSVEDVDETIEVIKIN